MNVCNYEVVVLATFHVLDPYNSTDFTLLWKMWSLESLTFKEPIFLELFVRDADTEFNENMKNG
jgi:hypothetical protein